MFVGFNRVFGWAVKRLKNIPFSRSLIQHITGNTKDGIIDELDVVNPEPIYTNSNALEFTGNTGEIYLPTISYGEDVVEIIGTSTASLSGSTIYFTDGTMFSIELTNGDHLVASSGAGTTVYNIAVPNIIADGTILAEDEIIGDNV